MGYTVPLVITNIASENNHLQWIFPWTIVIFNTYVKLTEGNTRLCYSIPHWSKNMEFAFSDTESGDKSLGFKRLLERGVPMPITNKSARQGEQNLRIHISELSVWKEWDFKILALSTLWWFNSLLLKMAIDSEFSQ